MRARTAIVMAERKGCVSLFAVFSAGKGASSPSLRTHATAATAEQSSELAAWIESQGGRCQHVQIVRDDTQGQTIIASKHVKKGQTLVSLPKSCQIHADSEDVALQELINRVPAQLWPARLALPVCRSTLEKHQSPALKL